MINYLPKIDYFWKIVFVLILYSVLVMSGNNIPLIISLLFGAGVFFFDFFKDRHGDKQGIIFYIVLCLLLIYGNHFYQKNNQLAGYPILENNINQNVQVKGKVTGFGSLRFDRNYYSLKVDELVTPESNFKIDDDIKIRFATSPSVKIFHGSEITLQGRLTKPEAFTGETGKIFRYDRYLQSKGVYFELRNSEIVELRENKNLLSGLDKLKNKFVDNLMNNSSYSTGAILNAMFLGDERFITENIEDDFRRSGLIHLLVLSGYNVMLVSGGLIFLLGFWPNRYKYLIAILAILFFVIFTGFQMTVIRAGIMIGLFFLAQFFGWRYDPIKSLAVVIIFVYIWSPLLLIYDAGFILSVLATLGIFLLSPVISRIKIFMKLPNPWRDVLILSLATQIMVMPYILFSFGEWSFISPLANLLIVPVIPIIMLLAGVNIFISFLSDRISYFIGQLISILVDFILKIIKLLADIPWASKVIYDYSIWAMIFTYAIIFLIIYLQSKKYSTEA